MSERFNLKIPLQLNGKTLEEAIGEALILHQEEFGLFFYRSIQTDDSRIEVVDDSLEVNDIQHDGKSGTADVQFMSYFYAGCKDMNSEDLHEETLEFEIENNELVFDLLMPIEWRIEE